MSITSTHALLDTQLKTVTGLPFLQAENIRFTIDGNPWCRSTLLPARSTVISLGVGATKQMTGLYQVDVIYPQDSGSAVAHAMADLVVAAFPIGARLTDGTTTVIIEISSVMAAHPLLDFYYVPIQVQWSVYE